MANGKIQPFTSLDQSKHHCYTLSTTCTLFKLASEVGPRTNHGDKSNYTLKVQLNTDILLYPFISKKIVLTQFFFLKTSNSIISGTRKFTLRYHLFKMDFDLEIS